MIKADVITFQASPLGEASRCCLLFHIRDHLHLLLIYSTFLNHSSSQQMCVLSDDDTGKMSKGHAIRTSHFKLWSEINYAAHMPQLISFISEPECQNTGENLNQDCLWLQDEVFENLTFSKVIRKKSGEGPSHHFLLLYWEFFVVSLCKCTVTWEQNSHCQFHNRDNPDI